jgi:hypothetical protein
MPAASGSFSGVGAGASFAPFGNFGVTLWADSGNTFGATIALERQFPGGPWLPVTYTDSTPLTFTAALNTTLQEYEQGALYRFTCTDYQSGPVNYRISQ